MPTSARRTTKSRRSGTPTAAVAGTRIQTTRTTGTTSGGIGGTGMATPGIRTATRATTGAPGSGSRSAKTPTTTTRVSITGTAGRRTPTVRGLSPLHRRSPRVRIPRPRATTRRRRRTSSRALISPRRRLGISTGPRMGRLLPTRRLLRLRTPSPLRRHPSGQALPRAIVGMTAARPGPVTPLPRLVPPDRPDQREAVSNESPTKHRPGVSAEGPAHPVPPARLPPGSADRHRPSGGGWPSHSSTRGLKIRGAAS